MKIFKDFCTAEGIVYRYGNFFSFNIVDKEADFDISKMYFFHDIHTVTPRYTELGRKIGLVHSGKFTFCKPSDFDMTLNQKYDELVKPLELILDKLTKSISCTDNEVLRFSYMAFFNGLDQNYDGYVVSYEIYEKL